jgi:hypothetical protein
MQQLQSFRRHLNIQTGHAGDIAAGPIEAGDKSKLDRVGPYPEDDRNLAGRRFGRQRRSSTAGSHEDGHSIANQLSRKLR